MLLTIERVTFLKRVSLFERTPDRVLAGLARTLEEETFPADDSWLRACAIHAAPSVLGPSAAALVGPRIDDTDPMVVETARWAVAAGR